MAISRLTEKIKLDRAEKFIIIYGNVNDEFCDDDLIVGNIDFMLWRYFQRQEYKRIVFFHGSKMIYFFDYDSMRLCLPGDDESELKKTKGNITPGPLGDLMVIEQDEEENIFPDKYSDQSNRYNRSMGYLGALEILDTIMLESIPTVVVFTHAEDLSIQNFGKEAFNLFQSQLRDWAQTPLRTLNKCIFIFQAPEFEKVKQLADTNKLSFFSNYIWFKEKYDRNNLIEVGFPDKSEINNLIHHFRLLHNLRINWDILDSASFFLAAQDINLKNWYSKLRTISSEAKFDQDLLIEWDKENFMKSSTKFLIENLGKNFSISDLTKNLSKIQCQDDSIPEIVNMLELWYPIRTKKKPLSLFFVGTSGVGKTFTVKLIAESLKALGYGFSPFRMTEYQERETVSNLLGSPTGYIGSEDEPGLFQALRKSKGKLIILFDEIEKAHPNILKALMQLLDEGSLSWSKNEGDFRNCIVCFTSNAQMKKVVDEKIRWTNLGNGTEELEFQNKIKDILCESGVAPEICRRINLFLVYNPLTAEAVIKIAQQEIEILASEYDLQVIYTSSEFLAGLALRASGSIYGVGSFHNYLFRKIGNLFVTHNKKYPDFKEIALELNQGKLEIVSVKKADYPGKNIMVKVALEMLETKSHGC